MNTDTPASRSKLLSDWLAIARALRLFFLLALLISALFFIFWWDSRCASPFIEKGPTEFIQTGLLILCTAILFFRAYRSPENRRALVLIGGLTGCMLIREQDYFLDILSHGCWKWPALALAFCCIAYACTSLRRTLSGLAAFVQGKSFLLFLAGLAIVLFYSRLFGTTLLWKELIPCGEWRMAKTAMEESSELLGYSFMLLSLLFHREKE